MSTNKKIFNISVNLTSNSTCKNYTVEFEKPTCTSIKCEYLNKQVKITVPEDCEPECIYAVIRCIDPDKCSDCPDSERIKICPCDTNADCEDCHECINNLCVSKCPEDKVCDNDRCVDCDDTKPCPCNQLCVSGDCKCPPDKPLKNDKGCCVSCLTDTDCPPCTICTPDGCKPIDCQVGVCDPLIDDCVECLNTGHCNLDNECCQDKKCKCCPGFVRDLETGNCVPEPECLVDEDCGPCEICQGDVCVPLVCPAGKVCVNGKCLPICDCSMPTCGSKGACVRLNSAVCYCNECEGSCEGTGDCGPGCICNSEDECVPNPCPDTPCKDGLDCGESCGCLEESEECVECASLSCDQCNEALGCRCNKVTNKCEKIKGCSGNCSGFEPCDDGCACVEDLCVSCEELNCEECANHPNCKCTSGKCGPKGEEECPSVFQLTPECDNSKTDGCKLKATLTKQPCNCDPIEFKLEQLSSTSEGIPSSLQFAINMFKGGDNYKTYLTNKNFGDTELVSARLTFESTLQAYRQQPNGTFDWVTINTPAIAPAIPVNNVFSNVTINWRPAGTERLLYKLTVRVEDVSVPSNTCDSYDNREVIGYFEFDTALVDSSLRTISNKSVKVNDNTSSKRPLFIWSKTKAGVETTFRKVYPTLVGNTYEDTLTKDLGLELGYEYRVVSDCKGCVENNPTFTPSYCCDLDVTPQVDFCNTKLVNFLRPNLCSVNSAAEYILEIYVNEALEETVVVQSNAPVSRTYVNGRKITGLRTYLRKEGQKFCEKDLEIPDSDLKPYEINLGNCDDKTLSISSTQGQLISKIESNFPTFNKTYGSPVSLDNITFNLEAFMALSEVTVKLTFNNGCFVEKILDKCNAFLELTTTPGGTCASVDKGTILAKAVGLPATGINWEINGVASVGNNPRTFTNLPSGSYNIKAGSLEDTITLLNNTLFLVTYVESSSTICAGVNPKITVTVQRSHSNTPGNFSVRLEKEGVAVANTTKTFNLGVSPQTHEYTITTGGAYKVVLTSPNSAVCIEDKTIDITETGVRLIPQALAVPGTYCLNTPVQISFPNTDLSKYSSVTATGGTVNTTNNTFTPTNVTGPYSVTFNISQQSCDYFLVGITKVKTLTITLTGIVVKNAPTLVTLTPLCETTLSANPKVRVSAAVTGSTISSVKLMNGLVEVNSLIVQSGINYITTTYIAPGSYTIVALTAEGCSSSVPYTVVPCVLCDNYVPLPIITDQVCLNESDNFVSILPYIETGTAQSIRGYYNQGVIGTMNITWFINNIAKPNIAFDTLNKVFTSYPGGNVNTPPTVRFPEVDGTTIRYQLTLPNGCVINSETVTVVKQAYQFVGIGQACDADNFGDGCAICGSGAYDLACVDGVCVCDVSCGDGTPGSTCRIDACGDIQECLCTTPGYICGPLGTCIPDNNPCGCGVPITGGCLCEGQPGCEGDGNACQNGTIELGVVTSCTCLDEVIIP